ncbi:hypothetical protein DSO57_1015780 [Entomophthora muscae]|uniref:Uncharacterized protein n=1 Tax=Entomophthora muscae TaxID=34485 RepID=A0ACC2T5C6_9FUNG|nr:hypothetical protein DSO57_1015780 [Entomophthora muscae]
MNHTASFGEECQHLVDAASQSEGNLQTIYSYNHLTNCFQPSPPQMSNPLQAHLAQNNRRLSFHSNSMPSMVAPFSINQANAFGVNSPPDQDFSMATMTEPINISHQKKPENWEDSTLFSGLRNSPHCNVISPISEDFYDSNESDPSLSASFGASSHSRSHLLSNPRLLQRMSRQNNSLGGEQMDQLMNLTNSNHMAGYSMSLPNHGPHGGWTMHSVNSDSSNTANVSRSSRGSVSLEGEVGPNESHSEDKRRRRRESHNAVERRRRENINDKIQELGGLLPDGLVDTNRSNKGQILTNSVTYIRYLQSIIWNHMPHNRNNSSIFPSNMSTVCGGLSNEAANFSAMAMALPNPNNTNSHP